MDRRIPRDRDARGFMAADWRLVGRDVLRRHDRRCRKFREVIELRRQIEALLLGAVAFAGQADEDDKFARRLCRIGL
jgi:hypothetical protein